MAKKAKRKAVRKVAAKKAKARTTIPAAVLTALTKYGEQTTDKLAQRTGHPRSSVSSVCSRLVRAKMIARTDGGGIGVEARYDMPKATAKKRGR